MIQVNEGDLVGTIIKQGTAKTKLNRENFDSEEEKEEDAPSSSAVENQSESENCLLDSAKIKEVVDRVTSNITSTLQTLIVSDRVMAAERNSNDWKQLCQLMANNPEIINDKMMATGNPVTAFRQIGPDFSNVHKVCLLVIVIFIEVKL